MTKQQILNEVRALTLWGMYSSKHVQAGSREDLLDRITQIRALVENEGATIS